METVRAMGPRPTWPGIALLVLLGLVLTACGPRPVGGGQGAVSGDSPRDEHGRGPGAVTTPATIGASPGAGFAAAGCPLPTAPCPLVAERLAGQTPLRVALLSWTDEAAEPLQYPVALALDRRGHHYVVDAGRGRIAVFDRAGGFVRNWGNHGGDAGQFRFRRHDRCPDDNPDTCRPDVGGGVAVDGEDRVYVADYGNHRVQTFDRAGRLLTIWGREGGGPGEFRLPAGIAVDGQGHVYVSDAGNHRIQQFDRAGRFLTAWGGQGSDPGAFDGPGALAVDGRDRLYVADRRNGRLQVFDRPGQLAAAWPVPALGSGDAGGREVTGVAVDRQGRVYVAGAGPVVRAFDAGGRALGSWQADWAGQRRLRRPVGLAVDADGDVSVADQEARHVATFRPLWPVTG